MFIGEYEHNLDEKKRISLPKAFRTSLGKKVVMTRGLDNCLFVYSQKAWEKVAAKLQELSFGRVLIPDHQKEFAGLKKAVVFAGVSDRVEIWDKDRWNTYKTRIEKQADALAEKLGEIGAL